MIPRQEVSKCGMYCRQQTMAHVRFTIQLDCENDEPDRIVLSLEGMVFDYHEDSDEEMHLGKLSAFLVLRGRSMDEGVNLYEAMDSIDESLRECFDALFDSETHGWKKSVDEMYDHEIPGHDVLFFTEFKLEETHRGKGIGAQIVRETIKSFGSSCGLVTCKPFALQYSGWLEEGKKAVREQPDFESTRIADFKKVEKFWLDLGFRKLPDSAFFTFAPHLLLQPLPGETGGGPQVIH